MVYCNNCGNGNILHTKKYDNNNTWVKSVYECRCGKIWELDRQAWKALLK